MPNLPRLIVRIGPVAEFVLIPLAWAFFWLPGVERLLAEVEAEATKLVPPYEGHAQVERQVDK